ncbi:MAG: class I SAM-dependent methyltransferase [Ignavibacteria bacterium]|nr:class I SAM-dependent methyltransferase [Ignavibacteria bacterium]
MIQEKVSGWDFSVLDSRMTESELKWDYVKIIDSFIKSDINLLDLGTGGGELLSRFAGKGINIYATESYTPNIEIAKSRLKKFGAILISDYSDDKLPFEDSFFDLIINRHESYNPSEVYRILKPGGFFITQQVDGKSELTINQLLNLKPNEEFFNWNHASAKDGLINSSFSIIRCDEDTGYTRFTDTEAVLFYIRSVPWQFRDYKKINFTETEKQLRVYFSENEFLDVIKIRFLIIASK